MIDYYTLSKKPVITLRSGAEGTGYVRCLDLLAGTGKTVSLIDFEYCEVTEYYVGRPDLISFAVYGTDQYADIICKVNDISNPFEINVGDILVIPSLYRVQEYIQNNLAGSVSQVASNYNVISPNNHSVKKLKNQKRAPNELTVNEENYTIDRTNNLIFY